MLKATECSPSRVSLRRSESRAKRRNRAIQPDDLSTTQRRGRSRVQSTRARLRLNRMVKRLHGEYPDGVRVTAKEMKPIEARLHRSETLPKYDITIKPKATEPQAK